MGQLLDQLAIEALARSQRVLGLLAPRDLPDIALDHPLVVDEKHRADTLDVDVLAGGSLERQIFVADAALVLQFEEGDLRRRDVLDPADLPELLPQDIGTSMAKHRHHEGIDVHDSAGVRVEDQDAVLRGLKDPSVARFRGLHLGFPRSTWPVVTLIHLQLPAAVRDRRAPLATSLGGRPARPVAVLVTGTDTPTYSSPSHPPSVVDLGLPGRCDARPPGGRGSRLSLPRNSAPKSAPVWTSYPDWPSAWRRYGRGAGSVLASSGRYIASPHSPTFFS